MELGLSIPDDLSVIGFDNTVLSAMSNPPLTTMAQSIQDMGRLSINLLLEEIKGMQRNKQKSSFGRSWLSGGRRGSWCVEGGWDR